MVRIVFFGTPAFAVPTFERLVASPHPIVGVVTQPDRPRGRGQLVTESPVKRIASSRGLPIAQPERMKDAAFLGTLTAWEPELGVVAAYGKILPDAVLNAFRLGIINVHASLLPKYRGAAPVHRAVIAGEKETGVTIIRLVREMDAGPMLTRRSRPIGSDETSDVVEGDLAQIGADLLLEVVTEIEADTVREEAQDHAQATFAPRLTKDEGLIDWSRPAAAIHNRVRGLHPWPLAFSFLGPARVLILRAALVTRDTPDPAAAPGQVLEAQGDRLIVAAGGGAALAICEIQPEGRRRLTAREFLAGHRVAVGAMFSSTRNEASPQAGQ